MTQVGAGALLAGKYRLEALIGRGGMGSVWRAEHLGLNAPVAVKLLDMVDVASSAESLNRFHREARAAAAIRSPHVVQILDHGVDEALAAPFIVMELMEGESLAQRLARAVRISPAELARVFTHVARALSRAHEAGIVHRDLKPDNVFLVRNEDEEVAKVLDFGIAKAQAHGLGSDSATRTGAVMGTAYYMSPEQISGTKNVDFRTDLWAFGVMACECLTGTRPFDAETIGGLTLRICIEPIPAPSTFAPVPAGFDEWFARIVNRDPRQRFASAREAADALRQVCTGDNTGQYLTSPLPHANGAVAASTATTEQPLSRTTGDLASAGSHRRKGALPWLVGGALVAASAGGLFWFRTAASHFADAPTPSASAPVAPATTEAAGSTANVEPAVAPSPSASSTPAASALASGSAARQPPAPGHLAGTPRLSHTALAKVGAPSAVPNPIKPPAKRRDLLDDR